jgi:hypothetical protein
MESIKHKKGQNFISFFFIIVILLTVGLTILVLNKTWNEISPTLGEGLNSAMPANGINITTTLDQVGSTNRLFDKLLPFLIIGLFGFVLISAGSIMRHPVMIFVGIIVLAVAVMLGAVYSNIYNEISSTDEFADAKADLPIQDKFMQYLPIIIFIAALGITITIVLTRSQVGGGL